MDKVGLSPIISENGNKTTWKGFIPSFLIIFDLTWMEFTPDSVKIFQSVIQITLLRSNR